MMNLAEQEEGAISLEKERQKRQHEALKKRENEVVKQAQDDKNQFNKNLGFKDPRQDETLSKGLLDTFKGREVRIFIEEFKYIAPSSLNKDKQPRDEIAIKEYCEKDLGPRIKDEGLRYPPYVSDGNVLDSGGNRVYSLEDLFPGEEVPVFILGDPYFVNDDGTIEPLSEQEKRYFRTRSRSRTNPKSQHQEMTMASVASCIEDLYEEDPTFGGLNPSGEKFKSFSCQYFNKVMDEEFPGYYVHKLPRSKIFNMLWNESSKQKSKIKPLTEIQKTGELKSVGWDDGLRVDNKNKRKPFGEHVDPRNKAYIGMTNTNGNNFESIVEVRLINQFNNGELEASLDKVFVFCEVYKPEKNIVNLNQQRNSFLSKAAKYNDKVTKLRVVESVKDGKETISPSRLPLLEKVYFPKQLSTPADKGRMYVWDSTEKKFLLI